MEHIRTWSEDDYRLELFDTGKVQENKSVLAYELYYKEELIFQGSDYCPSPLHSIDGDESVAGILSFLSLQPGDTDWEYFSQYTEKQLQFAAHHGDVLYYYIEELKGEQK